MFVVLTYLKMFLSKKRKKRMRVVPYYYTVPRYPFLYLFTDRKFVIIAYLCNLIFFVKKG